MKSTPWKHYVARRRLRLGQWLRTQNILTYESLVSRCNAIGVEAPPLSEVAKHFKSHDVVTQSDSHVRMPKITYTGVAPAEEPVAEEPVAEEPVAEEPVAEEPVAEEPVAEEPTIHSPPLNTDDIDSSHPSPPEGLRIDGDGFLVAADGEGE